MLTAGPMGMLAIAGMEYSWSFDEGFGTDGALMMGSVAGGVVEGG